VSRKPKPRRSRREKAHFELGIRNSKPGTGQSLVTSSPTSLKEIPPPYRADVPTSDFRVPTFIDLFCGIGGLLLHFRLERGEGRGEVSSFPHVPVWNIL